jgi:hypothetical protein
MYECRPPSCTVVLLPSSCAQLAAHPAADGAANREWFAWCRSKMRDWKSPSDCRLSDRAPRHLLLRWELTLQVGVGCCALQLQAVMSRVLHAHAMLVPRAWQAHARYNVHALNPPRLPSRASGVVRQLRCCGAPPSLHPHRPRRAHTLRGHADVRRNCLRAARASLASVPFRRCLWRPRMRSR